MKILIQKNQRAKTTVVFLSKQSKNKFPASLKPYEKAIKPLLEEGIFKGEERSSFFLPFVSLTKASSYKHLLLTGIGDEKSFSYEGVRQAMAKAFKELSIHKQESASVLVESLLTERTGDWAMLCQSAAEGALLASYKCTELKQAKKKDDTKKECRFLYFEIPPKKQKPAQEGLKTGEILGESVNFAKKLANYPGNLMTPAILARSASEKYQKTKIKVSVWDKKRIEKEKMGGLLGVSLGSSQEPRFIIMEYRGAGASKKPIALVGKGLTFDSGGISLKPSPAMDEMKFDMCGSAAVIGALMAIEKLALKVNVMGIVASSENMPGQSANKPGDILKARNGKTMEVLNTDAEGRLILADALCYASEQKPQAIFDAATLTGAILASLGNIFTGFFTKNKELAERIQKASAKTGERVWQLPLTKEHAKDIKSVLADVANISSTKGAGSSTAAAFLENFVAKDIPWAHFDIAGTAWNVANRLEYCSNKMASGVMVRTFVELARSYQS